MNLAYWHLLEGNDLQPGLDLVDKAISRFSVINTVPNMAIAYYVKSMLLLALNRPEEALEAAEKLIPLLDTFETIYRPQRCWLAYYHALATLGEKDDAEIALQKALDWIQTISQNLSDLHLRRCWLENIPANRLILKETASLS